MLIAVGAWRIIKQTVNILMEGTPCGVEIQRMLDSILSVEGIRQVYDLHVWTITNGKNALSGHVVVDSRMTIEEIQNLFRAVKHKLVHLGIGHVTFQPEDKTIPPDESILCRNDYTRGCKH